MSTLEQAAREAMEALDAVNDAANRHEIVLRDVAGTCGGGIYGLWDKPARAAVNLRAALSAQPAAEEARPVGFLVGAAPLAGTVEWVPHNGPPVRVGDPLYAAPPARPVAPAGWKWVPVEPTDEMLRALNQSARSPWTHGRAAYSSMLAAAPSAPAPVALSEEQIAEATGARRDSTTWLIVVGIARAIERAHGITAPSAAEGWPNGPVERAALGPSARTGG